MRARENLKVNTIDFLRTTQGKLAALFVFYIPLFCAFFFHFFEGQTFESPIGGCCLSMQGVFIAAYALLSIWIIGPIGMVYLGYRLYNRLRNKKETAFPSK